MDIIPPKKEYTLNVSYKVTAAEGTQVFQEFFSSKKKMEEFKRLVNSGKSLKAMDMIDADKSILIEECFEVLDMEAVYYE